jgi:hypothetical protein
MLYIERYTEKCVGLPFNEPSKPETPVHVHK